MFFVENGILKIKIWKDYGLVDTTILNAKDNCIVSPGQFHMFESLEDNTIVYEIYWVNIDENDIVRENVGGRKTDTKRGIDAV